MAWFTRQKPPIEEDVLTKVKRVFARKAYGRNAIPAGRLLAQDRRRESTSVPRSAVIIFESARWIVCSSFSIMASTTNMTHGCVRPTLCPS